MEMTKLSFINVIIFVVAISIIIDEAEKEEKKECYQGKRREKTKKFVLKSYFLKLFYVF